MKICDETVRAAVDSGLSSVRMDAAQKQAILAQCRPTVAVAPPARRLRPMKRVLALAAAFALVLCLGGGVLAAAPELQQKLAVLGEETLQMLQPINQVSEDAGIRMEVLTTLPGMHLYTANYLNPATDCKDGAHYQKRDAVCLETEEFPDAPNHPDFPDTTLLPDAPYSSTTIYRFDIAPQ